MRGTRQPWNSVWRRPETCLRSWACGTTVSKKGRSFFQWYFREYCLQHNKVVGGFDEEGRLRNMLHLNPYQVLLRGRVAEMPYIVGVATDPAARGHH